MLNEVVLIAAVGKSGQLGLNDGLPWGNDFVEDRIRFRNVTTGHIVVFGYKTWRSLVHLDGTHDRIFKGDTTSISPPELIKIYQDSWPLRTIFIAGGAKTYARWLPYITRFDITVLPYDGEADTWMPPLFVQNPVSSDRKVWLQAEIATLNRMIVKRKDRDPVGFRQFTSRRDELQAELDLLRSNP